MASYRDWSWPSSPTAVLPGVATASRPTGLAGLLSLDAVSGEVAPLLVLPDPLRPGPWDVVSERADVDPAMVCARRWRPTMEAAPAEEVRLA